MCSCCVQKVENLIYLHFHTFTGAGIHKQNIPKQKCFFTIIMEGIDNIFVFLQYLLFFRAPRNLVNTELEFQSWNSVHEERAALCGTAGQQGKEKFLLLPPVSKANWQLFVISA